MIAVLTAINSPPIRSQTLVLAKGRYRDIVNPTERGAIMSEKSIANLPKGLAIFRWCFVLFEIPWVLDKFTGTGHTAKVFEKFYKIGGLPVNGSYAIGVFWAVLLLAFALGFKKRISYGLVMILHGIATVTTIPNMIPYTEGFNMLFLAAIPTLGGLILLYLMREHDTIGTIDK
jgi:hypothetical protein